MFLNQLKSITFPATLAPHNSDDKIVESLRIDIFIFQAIRKFLQGTGEMWMKSRMLHKISLEINNLLQVIRLCT